jgi:prepilin-type N-terminal cleavage/methylation domain-containing protein
MKKAFTLIELLVAMALLAMLIAISGMVFSTAVRAYRTAGAAAEIAAKLSMLTNRLDRDFQSLPAAMPMAVWFEYDSVSGKRYDQIQFFSDGDNFESSKQWTYITDSTTTPPTTETETLSGNTARIYYGQANNVAITKSAVSWQRTADSTRYYNSTYFPGAKTPNFYRERATKAILARRVHLSTQLSLLPPRFPDATNFSTASPTAFIPWLTNTSTGYGNDVFEYDNISLADWTNILSASAANVDQYLKTSFENPNPASSIIGGRPGVDLNASDGQSLHMILAQGVGSFSIQFGYMSGGVLYWWPSEDPDGNPATLDSDFGPTKMNAAVSGSSTYFGYYINFSVPSNLADWKNTIPYMSLLTTSNSYPKAIKFTFTLYDSNGVFKDGKTFTYIVYLNN